MYIRMAAVSFRRVRTIDEASQNKYGQLRAKKNSKGSHALAIPLVCIQVRGVDSPRLRSRQTRSHIIANLVLTAHN